MLTVCITQSYLALGEDTHTLRLTSELVDLRVGYTKRIRRADARRATSLKLRRYDARCCIIFTEGYRSGHNEAVLKTVWEQSHVGSNPTPSATCLGIRMSSKAFFFVYCVSIFDLLRCERKGVFDDGCASSLALCIEVCVGVSCDSDGAVSKPSLDFLHVLTV